VSWVDTVSGQRMTPERLDAIRYNVMASHAYRVPNDVVRELLAELDAVTRGIRYWKRSGGRCSRTCRATAGRCIRG
jgi:hypothetical protein